MGSNYIYSQSILKMKKISTNTAATSVDSQKYYKPLLTQKKHKNNRDYQQKNQNEPKKNQLKTVHTQESLQNILQLEPICHQQIFEPNSYRTPRFTNVTAFKGTKYQNKIQKQSTYDKITSYWPNQKNQEIFSELTSRNKSSNLENLDKQLSSYGKNLHYYIEPTKIRLLDMTDLQSFNCEQTKKSQMSLIHYYHQQQQKSLNQSKIEQIKYLHKLHLSSFQTFMQKNQRQITLQYANQIKKLQQKIQYLKIDINRKNNLLILYTTNSQQDRNQLLKKIDLLSSKVEHLVEQRNYLYQSFDQLIQQCNISEQELKKYQEKYYKRQNQNPEDSQSIVNSLIKQLNKEKQGHQKLLAQRQSHQKQLLQLKRQNQQLKKQLSFSMQNEHMHIKSLEKNSLQTSNDKHRLFSSTIQVKVGQQNSLSISGILDKSSISLKSNDLAGLMKKKQKKQFTLEEYVHKFRKNQQLKQILIYRILQFFIKNSQNQLYLSYDPSQIIIKGQSRFLQVYGTKNPLLSTNYCYLAPQILQKYKQTQIESLQHERQSSIWNCGLLIHFVIYGESYFKRTNEIEKYKNNYRIQNEKFDYLSPLLVRMIQKNSNQRITFGEIQSYLSTLSKQENQKVHLA